MVRVVRQTVGDDVDIMLECYMGFSYAYSRRLLKELEPYNLRWVEEMLLPDEIHNFAKLKKETSIPEKDIGAYLITLSYIWTK